MNNIDEIELFLSECLKVTSSKIDFDVEEDDVKNNEILVQVNQQEFINISKLIREVIYNNPALDPDEYNKTFRQMYLKHLVNDKYESIDMEIMFYISTLLESSKKIIGIKDENSWITIFRIAKKHVTSNQYLYSISESLSLIDEKAKGKAMKALSNRGYKFDVLNSEIVFLEDGYKKILNEIESEIRGIGGINFLDYLFNVLNIKVDFNQKFNQYIFSRKHEIYNEYKGMIPWNYLVKISVKNFQRKYHPLANKKRVYKKAQYIIDTSINLGMVLNLQNPNPYHHFFITPQNVPLFLRNNIILDNVFFLPQFNIDYIEQILLKMIKPIFDDYELSRKLGFSFNSYINVMKYLLKKSHKNKMTPFNLNSLKDELNIPKKELTYILKIISVDKNKVNNNYFYMYDDDNTYTYPIIRTSNSIGYMLLPSIVAYSFFEALSNKIRKYVSNCDQKLGNNLEKMITSNLQEKNINYITGFYGDNEECDLIIEGHKTIVFIEIKKKTLTSFSKKGNDTSVFYDLSKSLLASQKQILKHEINLVTNLSLEIRENRSPKVTKRGNTVKLDYDNRRILKISLSSHEYGFLNDSQIVTSLLENLCHAQVSTKYEEPNNYFEEFKSELSSFQKKFKEGLRENALTEKPFFYSNFISLQQMLFIIQDSNNNEELINKLSYLNSVTNGTASFYTNYGQII